MTATFRFATSGLVSLGILAALPASANTPMTGEKIREAVTDRRIYLQVPLGGEFPLFYQSGGRVDGSGTARGVGVMARVNDTGRWWVTGNRLCQQWNQYENGRRFCFTLIPRGSDRLRWVRDDGLSGDARLGD